MSSSSKFRDRVFLFGAALSVCLIGSAIVLAFEIHHINQAWFFFAWSSIFLLALIEKEFRGYFRQPAFVAFFTLDGCPRCDCGWHDSLGLGQTRAGVV